MSAPENSNSRNGLLKKTRSNRNWIAANYNRQIAEVNALGLKNNALRATKTAKTTGSKIVSGLSKTLFGSNWSKSSNNARLKEAKTRRKKALEKDKIEALEAADHRIEVMEHTYGFSPRLIAIAERFRKLGATVTEGEFYKKSFWINAQARLGPPNNTYYSVDKWESVIDQVERDAVIENHENFLQQFVELGYTRKDDSLVYETEKAGESHGLGWKLTLRDKPAHEVEKCIYSTTSNTNAGGPQFQANLRISGAPCRNVKVLVPAGTEKEIFSVREIPPGVPETLSISAPIDTLLSELERIRAIVNRERKTQEAKQEALLDRFRHLGYKYMREIGTPSSYYLKYHVVDPPNYNQSATYPECYRTRPPEEAGWTIIEKPIRDSKKTIVWEGSQYSEGSVEYRPSPGFIRIRNPPYPEFPIEIHKYKVPSDKIVLSSTTDGAGRNHQMVTVGDFANIIDALENGTLKPY